MSMIDLMDERWWIPFFVVGAIPTLMIITVITYLTDVEHLHWTSFLPVCSVLMGFAIITGTVIWFVF